MQSRQIIILASTLYWSRIPQIQASSPPATRSLLSPDNSTQTILILRRAHAPNPQTRHHLPQSTRRRISRHNRHRTRRLVSDSHEIARFVDVECPRVRAVTTRILHPAQPRTARDGEVCERVVAAEFLVVAVRNVYMVVFDMHLRDLRALGRRRIARVRRQCVSQRERHASARSGWVRDAPPADGVAEFVGDEERRVCAGAPERAMPRSRALWGFAGAAFRQLAAGAVDAVYTD